MTVLDDHTGTQRLNGIQLLAELRAATPQLRRLLPGLGSLDINLIVREVERSAARRGVRSWQEAWNLASGATPGRPGLIRFAANLPCADCHGSRINRRLARSCLTCNTRGRAFTWVTQTALFAEAEATPR